ncbi:MAG: GntR family transcriptional regulator [Anaerolineales bacterium]|jgi:DNA-binding GntR family transcriptional regulator
MPNRKPIVLQHTRESLAEGVFRALRKAILEGELEPGEWLRQEGLAEELNVSQVTVRDALNQLVGEGLANRIPYKGVHVARLSPAELEDIYAMRAVLEGMAAKSAAKRISNEALQEMKEILQETIVNNDPESVPRAREANRRFHEIFIEASERRFLMRVLNQILDWIDPLMLYSHTVKTEIGLETRLKWGERDRFQHTRLVEALEAGDGELARQVATEAVEEAWNNLAELIFETTNDE